MVETFIEIINWSRFVHYAGPKENLNQLTPNDVEYEKDLL